MNDPFRRRRMVLHFSSAGILAALFALTTNSACSRKSKNNSGGKPPTTTTPLLHLKGNVGQGFQLDGTAVKPNKVCGQELVSWWSTPALCVDVNTDGTFEVPVDCRAQKSPSSGKTTGAHCVFLLVNDTLERKNRVLGFVSLNAKSEADDTLLLFNPKQVKADVDLGTMTQSSERADEGVSTTTLTQAADKFTVPLGSLIMQARADNMLKMAQNNYINSRQSGEASGSNYIMVQRHTWRSTALAKAWETTGMNVDDVFYVGFALQGRTDDQDLRPDRIRGTTTAVEYVPPAEIRQSDWKVCPDNSCGTVYSSTNPMRVINTSLGTACTDAVDSTQLCMGTTGDGSTMTLICPTDTSATSTSNCVNAPSQDVPWTDYGFNGPGTFNSRIAGLWEIRLSGSPRAWFDLDLASPVKDVAGTTRTIVPIPLVKFDTDTNNKVSKVTITWKLFNPASNQYEDVTDSDFLKELYGNDVMLGLSDYTNARAQTCGSGYYHANGATVADFSRLEFTDFANLNWYHGTPPAGGCQVDTVQVGASVDSAVTDYWYQ